MEREYNYHLYLKDLVFRMKIILNKIEKKSQYLTDEEKEIIKDHIQPFLAKEKELRKPTED